MKKFIAILLVLTMVLALAGTAMAACKIKADTFVEFTKDSTSYTAPRSSKKSVSAVKKGSWGYCDKVCGNYARVIVNQEQQLKRWFKAADLKEIDITTKPSSTWINWAKGGKDMSEPEFLAKKSPWYAKKGMKLKVSGHTNLRKGPSLQGKSQAVVEKGDKLKFTGYWGGDDRYQGYNWLEVCYKGKKLWIDMNFVKMCKDGPVFYK